MSKLITALKDFTEQKCQELVLQMRETDGLDYYIYKNGEYFALLTDGVETVLVETLDGDNLVRCNTVFRFYAALVMFSES